MSHIQPNYIELYKILTRRKPRKKQFRTACLNCFINLSKIPMFAMCQGSKIKAYKWIRNDGFWHWVWETSWKIFFFLDIQLKGWDNDYSVRNFNYDDTHALVVKIFRPTLLFWPMIPRSNIILELSSRWK